MASGFTNVFKGKISVGQLWQRAFGGAFAVYGPQAFTALSTLGNTTLSAPNTVFGLTASTGISVFTMGFGPSPGLEVVVQVTSVSSALQLKAFAGASFDPSTNTVIKSTYQMQITLMGLSSLKWGIKSVFPPPSTTIGGSGLTLSTTT